MSIYISREHRFQILIRTIAVSALLISLLQGTLFILDFNRSLQNVIFICIALLTLITAWKCLQNFKSHFMTLVVILLLCQLAIFVFNLIRTVPPFPFRLLQVAILLLYLSLLISALLILSWRINPTKIYLLIFSIALACFIGETTLGVLNHSAKRHYTQSSTIWSGLIKTHPILGLIYPPYSTLKTYYDDNPRGYFLKEDLLRSKWRLYIHEDNDANLIFYHDKSDIVRLDIKKSETKIPWHIQLDQDGLSIKSGNTYTVKFQARADSPRNIAVAVGNMNSELGLYKNVELTNKWQSYNLEFIATKDEDNAILKFNFGSSNVSVELSNVTLKSLPEGQSIEPILHRYYISYKFNAFGCRGRDYDIPKRKGTKRILLLGDSFTMGVGVREEDTFSTQLESLLNIEKNSSDSEINYEVINCGISGLGTKEERSFYELFGKKYEPDLILLVMVWNDDTSWKEEIDKGYVNRSPGKFESLINLWGLIQKYRHKKPSPNFSRNVKEILELNKEVSKNNARLGIVFFRNLPDASEYKKNIPDYDYLINISLVWQNLVSTIEEGLKYSDIPMLDLRNSLLEEYPFGELWVQETDSHANEIAHRIAAKAIVDFLRKENLLTPR